MRFHLTHSTWVSNLESLVLFAYRAITVSGQLFQAVQLRIRFVTFLRCLEPSENRTPQPRICSASRLLTHIRFRLIPFRSPLLGKSLLLSFPQRVLRCFSSPRIAAIAYGFSYGFCRSLRRGLPHSEISGS